MNGIGGGIICARYGDYGDTIWLLLIGTQAVAVAVGVIALVTAISIKSSCTNPGMLCCFVFFVLFFIFFMFELVVCNRY